MLDNQRGRGRFTLRPPSPNVGTVPRFNTHTPPPGSRHPIGLLTCTPRRGWTDPVPTSTWVVRRSPDTPSRVSAATCTSPTGSGTCPRHHGRDPRNPGKQLKMRTCFHFSVVLPAVVLTRHPRGPRRVQVGPPSRSQPGGHGSSGSSSWTLPLLHRPQRIRPRPRLGRLPRLVRCSFWPHEIAFLPFCRCRTGDFHHFFSLPTKMTSLANRRLFFCFRRKINLRLPFQAI